MAHVFGVTLRKPEERRTPQAKSPKLSTIMSPIQNLNESIDYSGFGKRIVAPASPALKPPTEKPPPVPSHQPPVNLPLIEEFCPSAQYLPPVEKSTETPAPDPASSFVTVPEAPSTPSKTSTVLNASLTPSKETAVPEEPVTPSRSVLLDEINESFRTQYTPNRKRTQIDFNDSIENDESRPAYLSLEDYRRETLERSRKRRTTDRDQISISSEMPVDEADCAPNDRMKKLKDLAAVHSTQYEQAKKALSMSSSRSERNDPEFVEACRIVLNHRVAMQAALDAMKSSRRKNLLPDMKASFTFQRVAFELSPDFFRIHNGYSCHFIVTLSYQEQSRLSPTIHTKDRRNAFVVDMYSVFNSVSPGFEIVVELYMLKLRHATTEKRHGFVETVVGTLKRANQSSSHDSPHSGLTYGPRFESIGRAVINSENMRCRRIPAESSSFLGLSFDIEFDYKVVENSNHLESYVRRFELVGGGGNWSMEYMQFSNWHLCFWKTHTDQMDRKAPNLRINIRNLVEVSAVNETACYENAFSVIYSTENDKKHKLLLAARSDEERERWLSVLKRFSDGLTYWK